MSSKDSAGRHENPNEREQIESQPKRSNTITSADSVTSSASSPSIQFQQQEEGSVDCVLCATNNFLRATISDYTDVSPEIFFLHYKMRKYFFLEEYRIQLYERAGNYEDEGFMIKIKKYNEKLKKTEAGILREFKTEKGYNPDAAFTYIRNLLNVDLETIDVSKIELTETVLNKLEFHPKFSNVILASFDINNEGHRVGHSLVFQKIDDEWFIIDSMKEKPIPISSFESMKTHYLQLTNMYIIPKPTQADREGGEPNVIVIDTDSKFLLSKKYTTRFYFFRLPKRASKSVPALVCANSWALSSVHASSGFSTRSFNSCDMTFCSSSIIPRM